MPKNESIDGMDSKKCQELFKMKAYELMKSYPKSYFANLENRDYQSWAEESYQYATQFAYTLEENSIPSKAYVERGGKITEERLTLAGYRLGAILNKVFS